MERILEESINLGEPLLFLKASKKDDKLITVYSKSNKYTLIDEYNNHKQNHNQQQQLRFKIISKEPTTLSPDYMRKDVEAIEYNIRPGIPGTRRKIRETMELNKERLKSNTFYSNGIIAYFYDNQLIVFFREKFFSYKLTKPGNITYLSIRDNDIYFCTSNGEVSIFSIPERDYKPPIFHNELMKRLIDAVNNITSLDTSLKEYDLEMDYKNYFLYYLFYEKRRENINSLELISELTYAIINKIIKNKSEKDDISRKELPMINLDFKPQDMIKALNSINLFENFEKIMNENLDVYGPLTNNKSILYNKEKAYEIKDNDNILYGSITYPGHIFSYMIDLPSKTIEIYDMIGMKEKSADYNDFYYLYFLVITNIYPKVKDFKLDTLINIDLFLQSVTTAYQDKFCLIWRSLFLYRRLIQGLSIEEMRKVYLIQKKDFLGIQGIHGKQGSQGMSLNDWDKYHQYFHKETLYFAYTTLKLLWDNLPKMKKSGSPVLKYQLMKDLINYDRPEKIEIGKFDYLLFYYKSFIDSDKFETYITETERYYGGKSKKSKKIKK